MKSIFWPSKSTGDNTQVITTDSTIDYVRSIPLPPKKDNMNPKDVVGMKKVSFTKFPQIALLHGVHAMMDGARKYGPYNWREKAISASIYIDACIRHLNAWYDGEENAEDSGVHHLGHAMACIAILLDALETGNVIDDRPKNGQGIYNEVLKGIHRKLSSHGNRNTTE